MGILTLLIARFARINFCKKFTLFYRIVTVFDSFQNFIDVFIARHEMISPTQAHNQIGCSVSENSTNQLRRGNGELFP